MDNGQGLTPAPAPRRSAIIGRGLVLGIVGGAVMGQLAMVLIVLVLLAARL